MWLGGARGRLGKGGSFATATRFLVDAKGTSSCMRVSPFFSAANCFSFSYCFRTFFVFFIVDDSPPITSAEYSVACLAVQTHRPCTAFCFCARLVKCSSRGSGYV